MLDAISTAPIYAAARTDHFYFLLHLSFSLLSFSPSCLSCCFYFTLVAAIAAAPAVAISVGGSALVVGTRTHPPPSHPPVFHPIPSLRPSRSPPLFSHSQLGGVHMMEVLDGEREGGREGGGRGIRMIYHIARSSSR